LQLVDDGTWNIGSVFTTNRVGVARFTTQFRFQLARGSADGFTFTIQGVSPAAIGPAGGGGLGFGPGHAKDAPGIPRSVAVKFDIWDNEGEGKDSTGLYVNGAAPTVPAVSLKDTGINLHTNHVFEVKMTYDGTTLKVIITDRETNASASQSYKVDVPKIVFGTKAYVGFTGATGGTTATPDILSWTFQAL